jgi:hypothetical protein
MEFESVNREELAARLQELKELREHFEDTVVFWGSKRQMRDTFQEVAENASGEYTDEEAANAQIILKDEGAFDTFIELTRESFDRGGINYVISEKLSALMQETAARFVGGADRP